MKKLSLILLIGLYHSVSAEYLIYKEGILPEALSAQEFEPIYQLLTRYSFPCNSNQYITFPELTAEDMQEMYEHEQQFLQQRIPHHCAIVYIPTILWQLLIIKLWTEIKLYTFFQDGIYTITHSMLGFPDLPLFWQEHKNAYQKMIAIEQKRPVRDELHYFGTLWNKSNKDAQQQVKASYQIYERINNLPDMCQLYAVITAEIITYLKNNGVEHCVFDMTTTAHLIESLINYFDFLYQNEHCAFAGTFVERFLVEAGIKKQDLAMILELVQLEYSAHEAGNFLVYRATTKWDGRDNRLDSTLTFRDDMVRPNSISYGNTLFDGLFGFDCLQLGATPYYYVINSQLAYVLKINKYAYARQKESDLLFVPPINALASLCGQGELFHTRSKVFLGDHKKICGIWWFNGHCYAIPAFLITAAHVDSASRYEMLFSRYLADNAHIVKNSTPLSTEQFIQNQVRLVDCAAYCDTSDGDWVNELNFPELKDSASHKVDSIDVCVV